jgi:HlyD family secretion protein
MNKAFYCFLLFLSCNSGEKGIRPQSGAITESVYASLTIQPRELYQAYAAVGGILEAYLVEEGDLVKTGDAIAQITNTAPELNVAQARLSLEQARQNYAGQANLLNELEAQLRAARLQFADDSLNFVRQKNLWEKNVGSRVEYDKRKLAFELSKSQLASLENRLKRSRAELENQLEQARVNYQSALVARRDFRVESKIDGKVYTLHKEPGELVSQQTPLASLGSADEFLIEMLIDEVDISRIREKQLVLLTLDAYPGELFEAEVSKIYPQKNERNQTFRVEASFRQQPERLYAGLSGEANIIIRRKEKALSIPRDYLIGGNQVQTEEGLVEVKTGLRNLERVEILAGLDSTTLIYKPE